MLYFSMTGGFLSSSVHGNNMPADAVEISEKVKADLLSAQDNGWTVQLDANGVPITVAPAGPTDEQLIVAERKWRDDALSLAQGLRDRHRDQIEIDVPTTLTAEQFTELLVYMQALRDWPQSSSFPDQTTRPESPSWLEAS